MPSVRRRTSSLLRLALAAGLAALLAFATLHAQIPSRNVNMVAGTDWPNGDPFLQRQNEPSIAASTRNPLHLLGGSNDYRTVDVPGLPDGEETGDAWLGLFKSLDGGQRWTSTLLPGYPQDTSEAGLASPLKGFEAGADAVVRAGSNGLFYFSGLAFNREENGKSGIFVARFVDNNNKEAGDPIAYLGTSLIAYDPGVTGRFLDKPWMAVDIPRGIAKCSIPVPAAPQPKNRRRNPRPKVQRVPAGRVYVAFSAITGDNETLRSEILVSISDDCGVSWSTPTRVSRSQDEVNQGATIAIDPKSGHAYVAWRRFGLTHTADADSIMVARLPVGARRFDAPWVVRMFPRGQKVFSRLQRLFEHRKRRLFDPVPASDVAEFDQRTTGLSFRSNAYPTMTVDATGRLYVAWSERGHSAARPSATDGDARIVMTTSANGRTFSDPVAVDEDAQFGHQLMPTLSFAGGRLMLVYYDVRETRAQAFGPTVSDQLSTNGRRQTIDIRAAMGTPGADPDFAPSVKVSDYIMGYRDEDAELEQLQVNPPNFPMFSLGSVPFIGDYIDVTAAPSMVPTANGKWAFNTAPSATPPVFHAVWTDNRDVRPPLDGNWANYTPVTSPAVTGTSVFDPTQQVAQCVPGNAGSRNQNIYTSRITGGLLAGSPGNSKTLSPVLQRGFVVFAQNNTTQTRTFRLTVLNQPVGGRASFTQFPLPPYSAASPPPVTTLDVRVPPRTTSSRTAYVTSTDPHARVSIDVSEIAAVGAPGPLEGGLSSAVLINPDIDNPDIDNPDIDNPDIDNPDIDNAEVASPDIDNPDIDNPDIDNPDIDNPDIDNPDIDNVVVANPDIDNINIGNPDIDNPDIDNPDIDNPDIDNPDIVNGSISDITWVVNNTGNTTAAFNVNLFLANAAIPSGIQTQLVLRKTYKTPATSPNGCELKTETRNVLLANIPHPQLVTPGVNTVPDQNDPAETNATIWLGPNESAKITLRVVDPDRSDNITIINERGEEVSIDPAFDPNTQVTPGVASQAVPSEDAAAGITEPPIVTPTGSNLFFLQQPVGAVEGQPITPTVRVRVFDNSGAALPGVVVTLALANNPVGAVLTGNVATSGLDGIATFPLLQVSADGAGFTLTASANAGSVTANATSQPFTVASPEAPSADLQVTQTHSPTNPVTGTTFTYTVVVANNGPLAATGVVLTDTLPAGFTVTNVNGATCQLATGSVTCQIGALGAGSAAQVTITGTPTQAVALVNTATVTSATFDAIPANNLSVDSTFAGAFGVCAVPSLYGAMRTHYPTVNSQNQFVTGDFNEDGMLDAAVLVWFTNTSHGVSLMLGDGSGFFGAPIDVVVPGNVNGIAAADFNEDEHLDLALTVTGATNTRVQVLFGNGAGGFTTGPSTPMNLTIIELKSADFNHDGHADLIVANFNNGTPISMFRGNGDGTFAVSSVPTTADNTFAIADLNSDGHLDIAIAPQLIHAINIVHGDGSGGFTLAHTLSFPTEVVGSVQPLADLNGDGRPELAVTMAPTTGSSARLLLFLSDIEAFYHAPVELLPASFPWSNRGLNAADMNGDGREDLIVTNTATWEVMLLVNNGLGGFMPPVLFQTDRRPSYVKIADLNGDARPDIILSAFQDGALVTLLNTCGGGASADLEVTLVAPTTAVAGDIIEGTMIVTNHGPDAATNVRDADGFIPGLIEVDDVCVAEGGADCDGFIPMNGTIRFTFHNRVLGAGTKVIHSMMTAAESDPNPANNMINHTIVVSPAPVTFTVTSTADFVDGSLRDVIEQANQNNGAVNRIEFNVPGPLPIVFAPLGNLPALTVPVVIDGTTQPGYAGTPVVELTGLGAGGGIGLQTTFMGATGVTIRGLAINRWSTGIFVNGSNHHIEGNYIGTDTTGTIARPNGTGVQVNGGANFIGGASPGQGNLISGNSGTGVGIAGTGAIGNQVLGNRIGTNAAGAAALANVTGVLVSGGATNNAIGGVGAAARNIISGNTGSGVSINGATTSGNVVAGNYIGTDVNGLVAVPNNGVQSGVFINNAPGNTVGGSLAGAGNVISGNTQHAMTVVGTTANGNIIAGNLIGTDATGTVRLANAGIGVDIVTAPNTIVGGIGLARNVISGNGTGVQIRTNATGNNLRGNLIGVGANGGPLGNTSNGVQILDAAGNVIDTGNIIANNGGTGVLVTGATSTGNTIRGNAIHTNPRGIDLGGDGPTPNDPDDADAGPNNLQNFPTIATAATGSTIVDGTLNSTPNTTFTLDFYGSTVCGPGGEGQRYLGTGSVTTDNSGIGVYHITLTPTANVGEHITATATDPFGNTSEFSGCVQVGGPATADLAVSQSHAPEQLVANTDVTYTLTVTNNGPFAANGVTLTDTLPLSAAFVNVTGEGCQPPDGGTITCDMGSLLPSASSVVTLVIRPTQANVVFTNTASVGANGVDPDGGNNSSQDNSFVSAYAVCASPTFSGPTSFPIDSTGIGVMATGDFDEDGNADVAVTETSNQVAILLSNGAGGFAPPLQIPIGSNPASIVARDFNEDGHLDLAVGAGVTNAWTQRIFIGDGDGGFTAGVDLSQPFSTFNNDSADFNGDGHADLVVTSAGANDNTVIVWLGNGNGTFGAGVAYASNNAPTNIVLADFDHSGTIDIAVANAGFPTVSILNGLGDGTFAAPVTIVLPNNVPRLRDVGDVDLDGWADLGAISSPPGVPGSLFLLRNNRNGGFEAPTEIIGPIGVGFTTNADFNGDGRPDLVAIGFQINQILIMEGDGAGGFTQVASYLTGPGQNHVVPLDLNGDERPDIVGTLRGAVYTLLNACAGDTGTSVDLATTITGPASASAGDTLTFTVTTTNNGPDAASAGTITIAVPTGMEYVSSAGLSCSELWGTVSCPAPPIPSDGEVEFTVQVSATGAGSRIIRAMATAAEADSDPSNDIGSATTAIAAGPVTFVVTNTTDAAKGSLRVAIGDANNNPGSINTIAFNIPGTGPFTIAPLSQLPNITVPVIIDGTTQSGYTGTPIIELNGINAGGTGLNITAGSSTVRGLVVNRWGNGIALNTNGGNVIEGNYIGTNVAGTAAAANGNGIVTNAPNDRIGGTTPAQRNVISGNTATGLIVGGQVNNGVLASTGAGTVVIGNYIGTNAAGTAAVGNALGVRVSVNNVIVGTPSGRNVISGNSGIGLFAGPTTQGTNSTVVLTDSTGLQVRGNYVGTDFTGTSILGNVTGIAVAAGSGRIGGIGSGEGNLISGNTGSGVSITMSATNNGALFVSQASGYVLEGNIIGLNAAGTAALRNTGNGVQVGTSSNTIGGATTAARNVVSGNSGVGVNITNTTTPVAIAANLNQVAGNYIGLSSNGTVVIGNGGSGVATNGAGNTIGGDVAGAGNVITGNGAASNGAGVNLFGGNGNTVRGNFIGTNPAGNAAMPNAFSGVVVNNSNTNVVGGITPAARNVISGNGIAPNTGHGVEVIGTSTANQITGNYIGTDVSGTVALPNRSNGINLSGGGTTIGGSPSAANVIAFNTQNGINVGSGVANSIRNNAIFSNGSLGIDLGGIGPSANDPNDPDSGANNLQNYPVISLAGPGTSTVVNGTINTTVTTNVALDFYASPSCDVSGFGEGQRFLGSSSVLTDASGNASFQETLAAATAAGEVITVTATTASGTSEFSACVTAGNVQPFIVTTTANAGAGSLRQAILDANATAGTPDTITFNLTGTPPFVISPTSQLPVITAPLVIDGTTQPGYAGTPVIELNGTSAGSTTIGLFVNASDSVIRGLALIRFGTGGTSTCPPCPSDGGGGIIFTGSRNRAENNYVGVRADGTPAGNRSDGIWILGNQNVVSGNIISGNGWRGIELSTGSTGNTFTGNRIGTNASGTAAIANGGIGFELFQASGNTVGGTAPGAGNLISGNGTQGLAILGNTNTVLGNQIGTNAAGTAALANVGHGVTISGSFNVIGGNTAAARNLISGNSGFGIGATSTNNQIEGNYVGVNASGAAALPNDADGIVIFAGSNTVANNVVSGNGGSGVQLLGATSTGNVVRGNRIGTNAAGTAAIANSAVGVLDGANTTTIGGTIAADRNIISGNAFGVHLAGSNSVLRGNYIGTDVTGSSAIPNGDAGLGGVFLITVGTTNNTIGGSVAGAGNVISGNAGAGIYIGTATATTVWGNRIGTNAAGSAGLANGGNGITALTANNMIGGSVANTIAFNGGAGVSIGSAAGNQVRNNAIFSNVGLGIDLPTVNAGVPVLTAATAGASTNVTGTLQNTPNTSFALDFFANTICDPSGFGEGQRLLGSIAATTNSDGNAPFQVLLAGPTEPGEFITATATSASGTTEFSACRVASPGE